MNDPSIDLPAESGRRPLFGDAPGDRIERIIADDWQRFSGVAFFVTGVRQHWVDAVAELDQLLSEFKRDGRSTDPLDRVFELLLQRSWTACVIDGSHDRLLAWMWDRMGLTETMGTYRAWLERRKRQWAEQRAAERALAQAGRDAERQARWDAQARQAALSSPLFRKARGEPP